MSNSIKRNPEKCAHKNCFNLPADRSPYCIECELKGIWAPPEQSLPVPPQRVPCRLVCMMCSWDQWRVFTQRGIQAVRALGLRCVKCGGLVTADEDALVPHQAHKYHLYSINPALWSRGEAAALAGRI